MESPGLGAQHCSRPLRASLGDFTPNAPWEILWLDSQTPGEDTSGLKPTLAFSPSHDDGRSSVKTLPPGQAKEHKEVCAGAGVGWRARLSPPREGWRERADTGACQGHHHQQPQEEPSSERLSYQKPPPGHHSQRCWVEPSRERPPQDASNGEQGYSISAPSV